MAAYTAMIISSLLFAGIAVSCNEHYSIKLIKSAKLVTINLRHIFGFLSFVPIALVSSLRYKVGVDYMSYTYIFNNINAGKPAHTESGYKLLNQLVGLYTDDAQYVYAVCAVITLALVVYFIYKYSPSPALSLFLFMTMGYLFSSFNILRQYVAIALIFASLKFIKEKRFLPFLVLVLIAMTFHKTAIIMIPFYFIVRCRFKQSYLLMIAAASLAVVPFRGVLTNVLVSVFYPQYAGTTLIQPLSAFEFIYYALLFGIVILLCFAYKESFFKDDYNLILFNCAFFSFVIYLCLSFVPEINRIAVYIEFFVIILIPRIFAEEKNKKTKRLYYALTIVAFAAFFVISIGVMGRYNVLPYSTIFQR